MYKTPFLDIKEEYNKKNLYYFYLLIVISFILIAFLSPITQSETYHHFAEQRLVFGIPHFGDVISNLGFIIAGLLLLFTCKKSCIPKELDRDLQKAILPNNNSFLNNIKGNICNYYGQSYLYKIFVFSCIALGFGSGYYHWNPTNATLAVDRLTMVWGFAVIFFDSCIRYGVFNRKHVISKFALVFLLFSLTILFWLTTGYLEPYVFVQFFTMFVIVVLAIVNRKTIYSKHLFIMVGFYFLAKLFETTDHFIFDMTHCISGHTLKHIMYAFALYYFGKLMRIPYYIK